jgi:hypothetical protein
MLQPFLSLPPSELSPREDRVLFSEPLAPLQLSTVLQNVPTATLSLVVSPDSHAFDTVAWVPPRTMGSLSAVQKDCFLVALGHQRKDRSYRQLRLLRSLVPSTSPFALT